MFLSFDPIMYVENMFMFLYIFYFYMQRGKDYLNEKSKREIWICDEWRRDIWDVQSTLLCRNLLDLLGSTTLGVGALGEVNKEVGEREEVANVDPDGHLGAGSADAAGDEEVGDSDGHADQELGDLHGGQVLLAWGVETNGSGSVVGVHDGVDEGVEDDKDPDGGGLVVDAGPHGDHGTGVVVGLEEGRAAALEDDDDGVDDLVELGEVENVAPVAEGAVPEGLVSVAVLLISGKVKYVSVFCN